MIDVVALEHYEVWNSRNKGVEGFSHGGYSSVIDRCQDGIAIPMGTWALILLCKISITQPRDRIDCV